jgi:hypothetical protein
VRGSHHHTGRGAQVPDGEREHRRGQRSGQQPCVEAGGLQDGGRVVREVCGSVPGVEADHHRPVGAPGGGEPGGHARGGAPHHGAVHAVRAGSQRPTQAGRAERQGARETVLQFGLGAAVDQVAQLCGGRRVDVVLDPVQHLLTAHERHRIVGTVSASPATTNLADVLPSTLAALGVPGEPNAMGLASAPRIVVLVIDGLGWNQLRASAAEAPFLAALDGHR